MSEAVQLETLRNLQGVNALLPDQTLKLAPMGLTTVFGYNGAGKSGYARVLKKLCRARGSIEPILPDVFSNAATRIEATVELRVGSSVRTWTGDVGEDGDAGPEALAHIGVYDRASGASFFSGKQKVELLPPGLDLLLLLRDALDHVGTVLKQENLADTQPAGFPTLGQSTEAGRFLAKLTSKTSVEALDKATRWSEEDGTALDRVALEIARSKAEDPAKRAKELRARASRIEGLSRALSKVGRDLSDTVADRVSEVFVALDKAKKAQALHADAALPTDALPGTGGEPWTLLWKAARAFSAGAAYTGQDFPYLEDDARCVLCQQELDDSARSRMRTFDAFVRDELAGELRRAADAHEKARNHLLQAVPDDLANRIESEAMLDEEHAQTLVAYVEQAVSRRDALLEMLAAGHLEDVLPALSTPPVELLDRLVTRDRARADELSQSTENDALEKQKELESELAARKALHDHRAMLDAEVERLTRISRRKGAMRECATATLSKLARKLTDRFVTDALVETFNQELTALGGEHLKVGLESAGAVKGVTYTVLALQDVVSGKAAVGDVLSEGEQRTVALAAFFADLGIAAGRSGIVFDDPVTSLDHIWREKVAQRLVKEAKERQVIVFTHDAVFLAMLNKACDTHGVEHSGVHIQKKGRRAGYCSDDPPWETKGVKQRVGTLKVSLVSVRKTHKSGTDEEYAREVTAFLDRLRKTWERAIEEYLFNGSVQRFGLGVATQRLSEVDVVASDYATIEAGMTRCSEWVHDAAQSLTAPPPSPDELAELVNDLIGWVHTLRARRPKNSLPNLKPIAIESHP